MWLRPLYTIIILRVGLAGAIRIHSIYSRSCLSTSTSCCKKKKRAASNFSRISRTLISAEMRLVARNLEEYLNRACIMCLYGGVSISHVESCGLYNDDSLRHVSPRLRFIYLVCSCCYFIKRRMCFMLFNIEMTNVVLASLLYTKLKEEITGHCSRALHIALMCKRSSTVCHADIGYNVCVLMVT